MGPSRGLTLEQEDTGGGRRERDRREGGLLTCAICPGLAGAMVTLCIPWSMEVCLDENHEEWHVNAAGAVHAAQTACAIKSCKPLYSPSSFLRSDRLQLFYEDTAFSRIATLPGVY